MRTLIMLVALTVTSALAAKVPVVIGGKTHQLDSVVVGGKTYVNVEQLKAALAAPGGANQAVSVEGCMNEWLFNGIWRLRVTSVKPTTNPGTGNSPGWQVTAEFRNGTKVLTSLYRTGVEKGVSAVFPDGNTMAHGSNGLSSAWTDAIFKEIPQGAGAVVSFNYWLPTDAAGPGAAPVKFLVPVDVSALRRGGSDLYKKVSYAASPNFRVDLTCTK